MMTIGHSTLPLEVFVQALKDNACRLLVDVRSIPRSRHNPQFEQETLFAALETAGIAAVWRQGLGGRRRTRKDSINRGWRNKSFRGYADYMQTPEFSSQIDWLMSLPNLDTTTVMCAEAVPGVATAPSSAMRCWRAATAWKTSSFLWREAVIASRTS